MAVQFTLRQARREDLSGMLKLVVDQGWNEVLGNLQILFETFPKGSIVAESAEGEVISTCISVPLDDSTGQIAIYVTKKSCRNQGIGRKVFDLSLKALGNRNVAINAVMDKVQMYASEYFNILSLTFLVYEFPKKNIIQNIEEKNMCKIVDITQVDIDRILDYDKKIHPMVRQKVLKWALDFAVVGGVAFVGDKIAGWGLVQPSHRGYRLMPLYGDTPEVAKILAVNLVQQIKGDPDAQIQVFFPEDSNNAEKAYSQIGVLSGECKQGKFKRLFTEKDVTIPSQSVYSILTLDNVLC